MLRRVAGADEVGERSAPTALGRGASPLDLRPSLRHPGCRLQGTRPASLPSGLDRRPIRMSRGHDRRRRSRAHTRAAAAHSVAARRFSGWGVGRRRAGVCRDELRGAEVCRAARHTSAPRIRSRQTSARLSRRRAERHAGAAALAGAGPYDTLAPRSWLALGRCRCSFRSEGSGRRPVLAGGEVCLGVLGPGCVPGWHAGERQRATRCV